MFPRGRRIPLYPQALFPRLRSPVPISLHINRESRLETLEHYQILYPSDARSYRARLGDRPFIVNPQLDTLTMSKHLSMRGIGIHERHWLNHLDTALKGGLKSIKYLFVPNAAGSFGRYRTLLPNFEPEALLQGLQFFPGLKELILQYRDDGIHFWPPMQPLPREDVNSQYQAYQAAIVGFHIPQITFELQDGYCYGRPFPQMESSDSDFESSDDSSDDSS